ncbi:MAG: HI0074 family nucleotidyltransferase substrate-binding subunit, partial [Selenomonadaceae bacterium]|nr:HI0074 family nucleotidyltransferase substrate-binding subunit [Selenomonadaceae bacterium]
ILFGSRARGTNHARSDIDLAVSGGDISNFAETLDEQIDTLLPFDVINLDENIDADFQAEIDRDGIILYEELSPAVKKLDAFAKSLAVLSKSNKDTTDEIYRMGIIGQFHLTFELSWKALREILLLHGVSEAASGSPREILKAGYQVHFLDDENLWLDMLKRRNLTTHVYNENIADELVTLIFERYITALENLRDELNQRLESVQ